MAFGNFFFLWVSAGIVLSRQDSTIFPAWTANPSAGFKRKNTPHCFVNNIGANFVVLMARHYHKTCLVCLEYQQTPPT